MPDKGDYPGVPRQWESRKNIYKEAAEGLHQLQLFVCFTKKAFPKDEKKASRVILQSTCETRVLKKKNVLVKKVLT